MIARVAEIQGTATGTVSDYQWAMLINPLVLGVALVLFLFLKETYPSDAGKQV